MYKIIACDLDETLLDYNKQLSKENERSIKSLDEEVKFVLASGKAYKDFIPYLKQLGLYGKKGQYAISSNGTMIVSCENDEIISLSTLPFETVERLFNIGLKYDIVIHIFTIDKIYTYNLNQDEIDYLSGTVTLTVFDEPDIDFLRNENIIKIGYTKPDIEYLRAIEEKEIIGLEYFDNIEPAYASGRYLEFNEKGIDKGYGLKLLSEKLGIDKKYIASIVDNYNDLPLKQYSSLFIGVANTVEELKPYCDYICLRSCEESAVSEAIEYIRKKGLCI
ncbi:MAG: HAD-IIB family hydrolase [Erysipelotrichaceae bacterium]|jgi:Cof subfamily protein (haloacid dehalogenase superfamily)